MYTSTYYVESDVLKKLPALAKLYTSIIFFSFFTTLYVTFMFYTTEARVVFYSSPPSVIVNLPTPIL